MVITFAIKGSGSSKIVDVAVETQPFASVILTVYELFAERFSILLLYVGGITTDPSRVLIHKYRVYKCWLQ